MASSLSSDGAPEASAAGWSRGLQLAASGLLVPGQPLFYATVNVVFRSNGRLACKTFPSSFWLGNQHGMLLAGADSVIEPQNLCRHHNPVFTGVVTASQTQRSPSLPVMFLGSSVLPFALLLLPPQWHSALQELPRRAPLRRGSSPCLRLLPPSAHRRPVPPLAPGP